MPNIALVLKAEIARVARKEVRAEIDSLKKIASAQRTEIAALKRRLQELERAVKKTARKPAGESPAAAAPADDGSGGLRFRPGGMASNRKRLELSAHDFGLLVGTTAQSVYAWEQGKSRPQARNLAAIAALRGLGKREVAARLEALKHEG